MLDPLPFFLFKVVKSPLLYRRHNKEPRPPIRPFPAGQVAIQAGSGLPALIPVPLACSPETYFRGSTDELPAHLTHPLQPSRS